MIDNSCLCISKEKRDELALEMVKRNISATINTNPNDCLVVKEIWDKNISDESVSK